MIAIFSITKIYSIFTGHTFTSPRRNDSAGRLDQSRSFLQQHGHTSAPKRFLKFASRQSAFSLALSTMRCPRAPPSAPALRCAIRSIASASTQHDRSTQSCRWRPQPGCESSGLQQSAAITL